MAPIFETIMNKNSSSLSNPSSQSSSSSSSFIVRNHAIGNNPCFPYDACIITHLGDDVDILLWEQSMNCGREVLPLQVFTTIAAYHMKKQPTVIYLLSGGPTWTKSFCEQLYANSSSSSEGRDDGGSSSSGSGSNSLRDSRRINQLRNLSDLEINLLQNDIRTNANLSHHGFLHQFRFLHDDNDDSYLAERFSNSAPMAQVSYEVMLKMMLLMIIMMVMVVAMMMMMMMVMMLLMMMMVSVNKFLMLAFFTSL